MLLPAVALRAQTFDAGDRAHRLFYSIGVLQNCHALTASSVASLEGAVERLGLSAATLDAARQSGLNRADWQWGNRGLGGYRRWCAGEGALAADWAERLNQDPEASAPEMDDGLPLPQVNLK